MNVMSARRIAVVMAGGSGERFWPLSRRNRPKQLLALADPEKSLIAQTVDRISPLVGLENVFIATAPHLVGPIQEGLPNLLPENVLAEPHKKNTAGCLVWVAATVIARGVDPEECSMAVLAADHRVSPDEGFRNTVDAALKVAEQTGSLCTIGIRPERPETGYGYIEVGSGEGHTHHEIRVRPVSAFKEKPEREAAEQYLAAGNYLWNSGTFFWKLSDFLSELKAAAPDLEQAIHDIAALLKTGDENGANDRFAELRSISIDYALMEKASNVHVAEAAFEWDDVGAWDALDRSMESSADGNITVGNTVALEGSGNIVYSDDPNMVVTLLGVSDLAVVVTKDAVLVIPKNQAQDVKKIVEALKERGIDRT